MSRQYGPDPTGMRHAIRCALLSLFSMRKHGTTAEVQEQVEFTGGYSPNTFKVQVAQVRRELMDELGIETGKVKGKLTGGQKERIEAQLANRNVQRRIATRLDAAESVYKKVA